MSKTINARVQMKADTAANWTTATNAGFVPLMRELIFFTDQGNEKVYLGNGTSKLNQLTPMFELATNAEVEIALGG